MAAPARATSPSRRGPSRTRRRASSSSRSGGAWCPTSGTWPTGSPPQGFVALVARLLPRGAHDRAGRGGEADDGPRRRQGRPRHRRRRRVPPRAAADHVGPRRRGRLLHGRRAGPAGPHGLRPDHRDQRLLPGHPLAGLPPRLVALPRPQRADPLQRGRRHVGRRGHPEDGRRDRHAPAARSRRSTTRAPTTPSPTTTGPRSTTPRTPTPRSPAPGSSCAGAWPDRAPAAVRGPRHRLAGRPGDRAHARSRALPRTSDGSRRPPASLPVLEARQSVCRACPRLVEWREAVALERRRAYADEPYWGRPIPGWGDAAPRVAHHRTRPGRARRQPHRPRLHRRPQRRRALRLAAPRRAGRPADLEPAGDGQRLIGARLRRRRAVRAAGQPPRPGRAGRLRALARPRARRCAAATSRRTSRWAPSPGTPRWRRSRGSATGPPAASPRFGHGARGPRCRPAAPCSAASTPASRTPSPAGSPPPCSTTSSPAPPRSDRARGRRPRGHPGPARTLRG